MVRRALAFDTVSVLLGCLVCFGAVVAGAIWDDARSPLLQRIAISVIAGAVALGAVGGLIALRRHRARWFREVAIYESYDAFAALAKESKGVIHDVGRTFLLRGPLGLLGSTRRGSIRDAYFQLQSARRRAAITESEYRSAIDELLVRASDRARL